jgi:hypothetical protein
MVNIFEIIDFPLAINCIAFCVVLPRNLVDYRGFVVEYVTWAACNSEMYFDLCALPQRLNWANQIYQNLSANWILSKNIRMRDNFFKNKKLESGSCIICIFIAFIVSMSIFDW